MLVIDDWAMAPLAETERRDFWEICEDRYQTRSTILTSQLPVARWHEQIGDPTLADGILDRLVHNAHRIEMRGDSMRKKRGKHVSRRADARRGLCMLRRGKGCRPFPRTPFSLAAFCLRFAPDSREVSLDEAEHFLHNRNASVATLRLLFAFGPECRSPSLRICVHLRRNPQHSCE